MGRVEITICDTNTESWRTSLRSLRLYLELLASNRELARRFDQLEARLDKKLTEHDQAIAAILAAIRELMQPTVAESKRRPIGFTADIEEKP